MYVVLALAILIAAAVGANPHDGESKFEHKILSTLDFNTDPCLDLYAFTCNKITPNSADSTNGTMMKLSLDTYNIILQLVEKIDKDQNDPSIPQSAKKVSKYLKACYSSNDPMGMFDMPNKKHHWRTCNQPMVSVRPPVLKGVSTERLMVCMHNIAMGMGYAMDWIYNVYGNYGPDLAKSNELMKEIKKAFKENVKDNDLLDSTFKENVMKKLDGMGFYNGYAPWVKNTADLDEYYANLKITGDLTIDHQAIQSHLRSSPPLPLSSTWPDVGTSIMVNAYYHPGSNFFYLPSGIQGSPFYEPGRPMYFNYATLAFVIGHEMTHSVDSPTDEDTWTQEAKEKYEKSAECYNNVYSSYPLRGSKRINGLKTMNENVADNGAMNHSYRAYRNWLKNHKEVSPSGYTTDHLFFLSYAYMLCDSKGDIPRRSSRHSPNKARVNVVLSLYNKFAETFKCNATEPMINSKGCKFW